MTNLVCATDLIGRPVLTLGTDDVGEVKDVVLGLDGVALLGFTLRKHGPLAGALSESLPWAQVHAIGDEAVMIADRDVLVSEPLTARKDADSVIAIDVLTDQGNRLGHLVDVVIETGQPSRVVAFAIEVEKDDASNRRVLVPVSEMVGVSGRALVVPEAAASFVSDDLVGLDAGIDGFRRQLHDATAE
jgi:uncharacterized protein YrrD